MPPKMGEALSMVRRRQAPLSWGEDPELLRPVDALGLRTISVSVLNRDVVHELPQIHHDGLAGQGR